MGLISKMSAQQHAQKSSSMTSYASSQLKTSKTNEYMAIGSFINGIYWWVQHKLDILSNIFDIEMHDMTGVYPERRKFNEQSWPNPPKSSSIS